MENNKKNYEALLVTSNLAKVHAREQKVLRLAQARITRITVLHLLAKNQQLHVLDGIHNLIQIFSIMYSSLSFHE